MVAAPNDVVAAAAAAAGCMILVADREVETLQGIDVVVVRIVHGLNTRAYSDRTALVGMDLIDNSHSSVQIEAKLVQGHDGLIELGGCAAERLLLDHLPYVLQMAEVEKMHLVASFAILSFRVRFFLPMPMPCLHA